MSAERGRLVVVGGGVRSGKSAFALAHAERLGARRAFIATAEAHDDEMRARAAAHKGERGARFVTVEEPWDVPSAVRALAGHDVVVVDCLTLWLSNLALRGDPEASALAAVDALVRAVDEARLAAVVVTNEVGMGVVPPSPLGRAFRDLAGRAHQRLARRADALYAAVLGVVLELRPGPVRVVAPAEGSP